MKKIKTPWGYVIPFGIHESFEGSMLIVYPGKEIRSHIHKKTHEWEVILQGTALVNGKRIIKGDYRSWNFQEVHGYVNDGKEDLKIFCITQPPYNPKDDFFV